MFTSNARRLLIGSIMGVALMLASGGALNQTTIATAGPPARSTLESYPGFRTVDAGVDDAAFDREDRARQNLIAKCMAANGMPYQPELSVTVDATSGVSVDEQSANDDYVASLTEARRVAYNKALYGMADPNALDQPQVGGCLGSAHTRIPGVFALRGKLRQELDAMRQQIAQDPTALGAERTWSTCMAAGGHRYGSDQALRESTDRGLAGADKANAFDRRTCAAPLAKARDAVRLTWEDKFVQANRTALDRHKATWEASATFVSENQ